MSTPIPAPLHVGNLPTLNDDDYPELPEWWVQLWPNDGSAVFARIYGGSPQDAREKAAAVAQAVNASAPPSPQAERCKVCNYQHGHQIGCENNPFDIDLKAQAERTALEQYDLEQSPDYRKGWDDGRMKGYEVGVRHGKEQHLFSQASVVQQEPVAWIRPSGKAMLEAGGYCTVYASDGMSNHSTPLYTHPAQQAKQPTIQHLPSDDTEGGAT